MADAHQRLDGARVGVGVIVQRDGKVLLGLRQGSHAAGEWALPGGSVDFGEHPHRTAVRELAEETGLTAHSVTTLPCGPTTCSPMSPSIS